MVRGKGKVPEVKTIVEKKMSGRTAEIGSPSANTLRIKGKREKGSRIN